MSALDKIGTTRRPRPSQLGARVHPSWLDAPAVLPARLDASSLRRLWDAVDGD